MPQFNKPTTTSTSRRRSTQLNLLSWFSSKQFPWSSDDKKNDNNDDVWGAEGDGTASTTTTTGKMTTSTSSNKAGLGGVAGIMDSMENFKTAQQVGKMTNALVQELAATTVEGVAVDGKVKVVFDGQQRPLGVQIDETYLANVEASDLSVALTTAMKDAYRKSAERMDEKMKSFYVDLGL